MSTLTRLRRSISGRHGALVLFVLVFVCCSLLTRLALLIKAGDVVTWDASLMAAFGWGLVFDLGAAAWFSLPLCVGLTLLPSRFFAYVAGKIVLHCALFATLVVLLFDGVAEWFFWDEFGTRFNFIAVDYLVYTNEVLGNIVESYPIPRVLAGVLGGAALLHCGLWWLRVPQTWLAGAEAQRAPRLRTGAAWLLGAVAGGSLLSIGALPAFSNAYNRSIAQNGPWSLFAAFRGNELDYEEFYPAVQRGAAFARLREDLVEDDSMLLVPDQPDTLRYVSNVGAPLTPNIVQITVESLSASFMGSFNPASTLTPNLDALARKSLFFDNFFATGTRTVRGMEALTMSIPPTPGRSIVKRPENGGMFTLGSVLRARGYETVFLYGGYGYFDNMNAFFSGNGYRVVDRACVDDEDVTFANAWGACDGDLYDWTLREADAAAARRTPFHFFVMTTSNHRPYTFPEGKIDRPSKTSGRDGAVAYTDYAIGEFLRKASERPWFENTIFVVVADHCAASSGKSEIPLPNYHIPLLVYAPGGQIAPGRNSTLMSQIDYAPTLLGRLNWSYPNRFFGHDVARIAADEAHALVGTHQLLGHLEHGELTVLSSKGSSVSYAVDADTLALSPRDVSDTSRIETIAYYQTASDLYRSRGYRALTPAEELHYTELGREFVRSRAGEN